LGKNFKPELEGFNISKARSFLAALQKRMMASPPLQKMIASTPRGEMPSSEFDVQDDFDPLA
jgi:hypothetical protein